MPLCALWLMVAALPVTAQHRPGRALVSLAGAWRSELDPEDKGVGGGWFNRSLGGTVQLPCTTDTNQQGTKDDVRHADRLSRKWTYAGKAWYQREIDIPASWAGKRVTLFLERTRVTRVWLDAMEMGAQNVRLSVPHVYELSGRASPGHHRLTILVDNAQRLPAGGHLVSEDTQTNWNGILGRIELLGTEPVWMEDVRVTPDVKRRVAAVRIRLRNNSGEDFAGSISLGAESFNTKLRGSASAERAITVRGGEQTAEIDVPMGAGMLTWDEFDPALYRLTATLSAAGSGQIWDRTETEFGMRDFGAAGTMLSVNGKRIMLRGRHDSGVFPLTGFPPMDVESWMRYFQVLKSYGLNHVRFHSWCPPEAAFQAAAREGFYLAPELPLWGAIPDHDIADRVPYLEQEGRAIMDSYGNSPAFCMFTLGNELGGERPAMAAMVSGLRAYDGRHAYAIGTNAFFWQPQQQAGDDFWVTMRTREGEAGRTRGSYSHADLPLGHIELGPAGTQHDYRAAMEGVTIPLIGHEVGQYQTFPNFDEAAKYKGVLEARNFGVMRERLEKAGMLDQWRDFVRASGALSVLCYREEIEAALRTPGFAGFQLLDIQDYPGQGTALVGILDAFMESKGLITAEQWREFCNRTVPLLRFDKYVWTTAETFRGEALLSHFGPEGLEDASVAWTLTDGAGNTVRSGNLAGLRVAQGSLTKLGAVTIPLEGLPAPARYELLLTLRGTQFRNRYPVWVFPAAVDTPAPGAVWVSRALDAETRRKLEAGGTVLLFPELKNPATSTDVLFMTDFWCYPMFKAITDGQKKPASPGTMGLLMNPAHAALRQFPTDFHTDWQWWNLVKNSRALILDETPANYRPIVQAIDNPFRDHKLGLVMETRFGGGKLLICGIDLPRLADKPEARQLMRSLLDYAASSEFHPAATLDASLVVKLVGTGTDPH
jgi:hypothetical protein